MLAGGVAALVAPVTAAHAREASAAEVSELARAAAGGDRRALADLRSIDRVDGRAATLGEALRAGGGGLRARLRALSEAPARRAPEAATVRREARELLAEDRFHEPSIPRPLRGVFVWLGERIDPLADAIGDAIDRVAALLPGGRPVGYALLAGAALLGFAALASRTVRLRSRRRVSAAARNADVALGPSPAELERAAMEAERAGDLSLAVRLRFRAGLVALERQGSISLRASLTTAAIAGRLDSREFAAVASSFEEVAYGGRPAAAADVDAQRAGWPRVLEEARS